MAAAKFAHFNELFKLKDMYAFKAKGMQVSFAAQMKIVFFPFQMVQTNVQDWRMSGKEQCYDRWFGSIWELTGAW